MLNDWNWEIKDNSECRLRNDSGHVVAYLTCNIDDRWTCRFDNDEQDIVFWATFEGMKNQECAIWQATLWIYNTCNRVANSFHHIRDHLPSMHELRMEYENKLKNDLIGG